MGGLLRANIVNTNTTWVNTVWYTITDAPHPVGVPQGFVIEFDWKRATTTNGTDGYLTLWLDGAQKENKTGIGNGNRLIDKVQLGMVGGRDTGTSGAYYFDAFESRRNTYIGGMALNKAGLYSVVALPRPKRDAVGRALRPMLAGESVTTVITYTYDPLYRLTNADYSDGTSFAYTYDSMGNRLTEQINGGAVLTYTYDIANRLTSVGGVTYTWDDNGNLLSDGTSTYTYDSANRLIAVSGLGSVASYTYNDLGDRVSQTVNGVATHYTLDLNTGLTQVLSDGTNAYLYGKSRIAQYGAATDYFLTDALGSVRQLADSTGAVTLAKSYQPYGSVMNSAGSGASAYGYTGEQQSGGLVYLRARYYASGMGRFLTRDSWGGDANRPMSYNKWLYVTGSPINRTDPSGLFSTDEIAKGFDRGSFQEVLDSVESFWAQGYHPRWGLLMALLDARDGDAISLYGVSIDPPSYVLLDTEYLSLKNGEAQANNHWLGGLWMTANSLTTSSNGGIPWRDKTPKTYHLMLSTNHTAAPLYQDGRETDLPDFYSVDGSLGFGSFRAVNGSLIVDRYGQVYYSVGLGAALGLPIAASYSEGYVVANRADFFVGRRPLINSPEAMVTALSGISANGSANLFLGIGCSNTHFGGSASAVVYSEGLSFGVGVSGMLTRFSGYSDPSLGWDWIMQEDLNGLQRVDVERKAAQQGWMP